MYQIDARAEFCAQFLEARLRRGKIDFLGFLHQRADPIGALTRFERAAHRILDFLQARHGNGTGIDRLAAGRFLAQFGYIHVAEVSQHQSARDRRGGQHEYVNCVAFLREGEALMDAEAMLLIDHGQRQIAEGDILLEQRMGADQQIDVADGKPLKRVVALTAALAAGQDRHAQTGGLRERRNRKEMLAGEYLRRRHEGGLAAGLDHGGGGDQGHDGLAGADIALQEPQHTLRQSKIVDDVVDGLLLRMRERIGQRLENAGAHLAFAGCAAPSLPAHIGAN